MSNETETRPRVALATAAEMPDLDDEGRLLLDRLVAAGADAEATVWDDDGVDWAAYDVVVVRSTWDYAPRLAEFLRWAERVEALTRLANPVGLLRWSTDKAYLRDLERAGLPIVTSAFVAPGEDPRHGMLEVEHVVKPTVSAGSKDTLRLTPGQPERSVAHVEAIQGSGRTALVQPYLAGVDELGETALIYLDGAYSHAIRKGPLLAPDGGLVDGLFAEEDIESREPSAAEREIGDRVLAVVPGETPLYARVDLLPGEDGPRVLELELAEPSLFLDHAEGSADRLVAAILRLAGHPGTT